MLKEIQVLSTGQGMTHARNVIDAHAQDLEVNGELLLPTATTHSESSRTVHTLHVTWNT
jgi:hypothetical protein